MQQLIEAGGLMNYIKKFKMKQEEPESPKAV